MRLAAVLALSATILLQGGEPAFTPVQPELLSMPGSLSNAWADYDGDGDPDLAVSLKSGEIRLYRNDRGTLVSVGAALGLPTSGHEYRGLSWGDYNGDGRIDLFAGSSIPDKPSALFHNDGKRFRDVAAAAGLTVPGRASRQNNWVDYDNDGDLDLYATDRAKANRLYQNTGRRFTQVLATGAPTVAASTVGACWLDHDKDGDLDLFLANQSGKQDALFRNDAGKRFVDVGSEIGIASPGRTPQEGGVGCAVGDYDTDGNLDIFVPNYGKNALWKGDGRGGFTAAAEASGVGIDNHAVGAAWGDYDNDGDSDLSVMSYKGEPGKQVPTNSLFRNDGGRFVNVLTPAGVLDTGDHGVAWVDYDRDGDVDLSLTKGYGATGGHYLFRNALPLLQARRSLAVLVLDHAGRYTQQGAEVRIYDVANRLIGTGQVATGGGYGAQSATPVHFGLRTLEKLRVEVTFMSPTGRKTQNVSNVDPRRLAGRALVVRRQEAK